MNSVSDSVPGVRSPLRLNSRLLLLRALLARPEVAGPAWHTLQDRPDVPAPDPALWRVLPLLHARLQGKEAVLEPARAEGTRTLAAAAATAFEQTRYRNALLLAAAEEAVAALAAAGLPVALLKGAALVSSVYTDPALRPMSDADLLVRPEDAVRALSLLRDAGWQTGFEATPQNLARSHSAPLTTAALGSIDLHWRAFDGTSLAGDDAPLWAQATNARFGAVEVKVPAREALFVHACLAGTRFEGEAAWRWMADAAALVADDPGRAMSWSHVESEAVRLAEPRAVADAVEAIAGDLEVAAPRGLVAALRAAPLPWVVRTASTARRVSPEGRSALQAAALHLDGHRRLVRLGVSPAGPLGFARSVAFTWGVSSLGRLPREILRRSFTRVPGLTRWRRFRRRPAEERGLLMRLVPLLAVTRAALFLSGVPRARGASARVAPRTALDPATVETLCVVAASVLPGSTPCLPRAIACESVLRASGLSAELRIGVAARPRPGDLDAHAWVEVDGRALDPASARYTALPLFGARG